MPVTVYLAAAAVALSVPLLWWSIAGARSNKMVDRSVLMGTGGPTDLRVAVLQQSGIERARPALGNLGQLARRLTPVGWYEALERRLMLAGRPAAWTMERVLVGKLVLGTAGFGLGFVAFADKRTVLWLLVWGGMTTLGYFAPDLLLYSRGIERRESIQKSLPDTLDQMTIAVEAGLGFESAMARAGRTGEGPLADELVRTLQEVQIGVPRSKALRNLADRTEQPDLRHFVLAVVQAENYGIPIAEVLRVQAAEQRMKRRQRAEEKAMKIPVKIIFPLILCILPTLFIVILGPAAIQMSRTLFGDGGAF
ncbi:type II secretion system F family protein [Egicoccus sp. AB-alg6-2]|uniref:type II secretion system F family protein n=1 Tax=Egicoccus sp. AB-alg6-2 TaxID=3242692 RepID=UPI00359D888B